MINYSWTGHAGSKSGEAHFSYRDIDGQPVVSKITLPSFEDCYQIIAFAEAMASDRTRLIKRKLQALSREV